MNINIVAIIQFYGAMNVTQFVTDAQKLYDAGTRNLVLDMSGLTFISSAGVSALQKLPWFTVGRTSPPLRRISQLPRQHQMKVKMVFVARNISNCSIRMKPYKMCSIL
jgi:hypothetical protein